MSGDETTDQRLTLVQRLREPSSFHMGIAEEAAMELEALAAKKQRLVDTLLSIEAEVRGIGSGERKGYLLAVVQRVRTTTKAALHDRS